MKGPSWLPTTICCQFISIKKKRPSEILSDGRLSSRLLCILNVAVDKALFSLAMSHSPKIRLITASDGISYNPVTDNKMSVKFILALL